MSTPAPGPGSVLETVWRERDAWSLAAREGKTKQERARLTALSLGVVGALLGTVAGLVPPDSYLVSTLAVVSACLIALAGYFGRELLTPERETGWARARLLVEALKRECWRYVMGVPPYDGADAHARLLARADEMVRNRGLERPPMDPGRPVELPSAGGVEDYLDHRALEQAGWYERRAGEQRVQRDRLNRRTFMLGAGAVVLGVVGSKLPDVLAFVPVVTTATAAVVAWIQGNRIGATIPLYQEAASQLRLQAALWRDSEEERPGASPEERRAAEVGLVERCEEIMARENGAWRAEWLSEKRAQEAFQAIHRVQELAQGAGDRAEDGGPSPSLPVAAP